MSSMEEGAEGGLHPDEGVGCSRDSRQWSGVNSSALRSIRPRGHAALLSPATESRNAAIGRGQPRRGAGWTSRVPPGRLSNLPELSDDSAEIRQQLLMETEFAG